MIARPMADALSLLLEPQERQAVLGDLVEAGEGAWQTMLGVLGLVVRRESALWKNWRPWLAAFGIALPGSFFLMGLSVSVSLGALGLFNPAAAPRYPALMGNALLLAGCSWAGGFAVGFLSRRTVWVSAALSFFPCLFCLSRFRIESLSRLCLLLFLPSAIWGVRRGLQIRTGKG